MKKIMFAFVFVTLLGCSQTTQSVTCKQQQNNQLRVVDYTYNDKNELVSLKLSKTYTIDESLIPVDNVEQHLKSNIPKDEGSGIEHTLDYNKDTKEVVEVYQVDINALEEKNYPKFSIPLVKNAIIYQKDLELAQYSCE